MSPQFKAGIKKAIEQTKVFGVRHAPVIAGVGGGALMGNVLSPRDEPGKYRFHGAVIGGLAGLARLKTWQKGLGGRWQVSP